MKAAPEQQQGLLQPEQFDFDDVEATENDRASGAYSQSRKSRAPARWSRRKYLIWGLVVIAGLLIVGTALNKGAGIKIPKLYKTPAAPEEPQDTETEFDGPAHPKMPLDPEPPTSPELPTPSTSPSPPAEFLHSSSDSPSKTSALSSSNANSGHSSTIAPSTTSATSTPNPSTSVTAWEKPSGFKIIGFIFFGRPPVVEVLDCYLKKNLVSNGGWLDEVQFVVNTHNEDDIGWLDTLVEEEELYKKITKPEMGYNHIWELVKEEHMYIKIDDDIVCLASAKETPNWC